MGKRKYDPPKPGDKFGRLTVVSVGEEKAPGKGAQVACGCACGGQATVNFYHLVRGHTQSCGCLQLERSGGPRQYEAPLPEAVFGRLTVLSVVGEWATCRCECGQEKKVALYALRKGHVTSCGCRRKNPGRRGRNRRAEDIKIPVGTRFGLWEVVEENPVRCRREFRLRVRCAGCGEESLVSLSRLELGQAKSCLKCRPKKRAGESRTVEYRAWLNMKSRCYNPNNVSYKYWGGKGVEVSSEWRDNYPKFLAYMGRRPSPAHSLGRLDGSGNYEPGNVAWQTDEEQARNMSSNVNLTVHGKTQCLAAWAQETGVIPQTIKERLRGGWGADEAVSTPTREQELLHFRRGAVALLQKIEALGLCPLCHGESNHTPDCELGKLLDEIEPAVEEE